MTTNTGTCQANGSARRSSSDESATRQTDSNQYHRDRWNCWDWCSGSRKGRDSNAWFGVFLVVIGVLWLADTADLIRSDYFWPLAMIAFGLWIGVLSRIRWKTKD